MIGRKKIVQDQLRIFGLAKQDLCTMLASSRVAMKPAVCKNPQSGMAYWLAFTRAG